MRRVGIATVVGMLFMALIFLIAIGAQVYISDAQDSAVAAQSEAQQRVVLKGQEELSFVEQHAGVEVFNGGPATISGIAMLMKFENGSVIELNGTSSPRFDGFVLPSGGSIYLRPLVPNGTCPFGSSCSSDYLGIVGEKVPGQGVGLVTSLGNTFWYVPAAAPPTGQDATIYATPKAESTSSQNYTGITGLSFTGSPDSLYEVQVQAGFWQSGPSPNGGMFAVGVSNGTSFMFCGGLDWSVSSGSFTDLASGNACLSVPDNSLGPTWTQANPCLTPELACEFVGTAYVNFGAAGGTFRLEFEGTPSGQANVFADSVMIVIQLQ